MKKLIPLTLLVLMSCGKSTTELNQLTVSSIINGSLITNDDLASKSTVALITKYDTVSCTGTLISENLILTAAHCLSYWTEKTLFKSSQRVVVLSKLAFKLNSSTVETKIAMDAAELYPVKDGLEASYHDIAVVKFTGTLPKEYKPAAILAPEYKLVENQYLLLAGFGFTSQEQNSADVANPVSYQIRIPYKETNQSNLILKQNNGTEGAYIGDSGGPAYLESKNELLLAGSTVGGIDGQTEVYYTKVSDYKKFILEAAKKLNATPPVFKMPEE